MRWVLLAAVLAALSLAAFAAPFGKAAPDLRIKVSQIAEADLSVVYEWRKPRREIILNEVAGGYRERRWEIATPGFKLLRLHGEDRIIRADGKKFSRVEVLARPDIIRIEKEYQPVARYGAGGALIYTGHLWPMTASKDNGGGRVNATFDFVPATGGHVVAFGANEPALTNWRSPMAHPAFVYLGPLNPVETDHVMALIDPDAPQWMVEEFNMFLPASFDKLAALFGFSPETKPNLFLSAPLGRDESRLSYAGDALPAQFQITLQGAAWKEKSEKAQDIFVTATIHEAVHLWQAAARPGTDEPPEWIHEGAADAIAAEVMVALGEWDSDAYAARERAARRECAVKLKTGSLNGAKARGDFRALYACGHVIAVAVSRADGKTTADFWRDFIERAGENGYSEDMFYDLVADRTGDEDFADRIEDFARTPLAQPAKAIDALFASAQSLARERGR